MMNSDVCCQLLSSGDSPFDLVQLGWYDGVTEAMVRCRRCGRCYHAEMMSWDEEHDRRVFGLQEVSATAFDEVRRAVDERAVDAATLRVRDALAAGFGRRLFIIASDPSKTIIAARDIHFGDWDKQLTCGP